MVVSAAKLFGEQQQDKAAIAVRVVKAHKLAVLEALSRAGDYASGEELAEAVALAVLAAEDHTATRYAVVTQDPHKNIEVYGPFLTRTAAENAVASGWCAHAPGTRGRIVPITVTPKATKRKTPTPKKASGKTKRALS